MTKYAYKSCSNQTLMPNLNETVTYGRPSVDADDVEPAFFSVAMLQTPAAGGAKKEKRRTLIFEAETTDEDEEDDAMDGPDDDDDVTDVNWTPGIEMRRQFVHYFFAVGFNSY